MTSEVVNLVLINFASGGSNQLRLVRSAHDFCGNH